MLIYSDPQCSCYVPDPRELYARWVSLCRSDSISRPWPVHTHTHNWLTVQPERESGGFACAAKKKEHKKYWQLFTEHTCCSLTSLLGIKHCGNVLLWRASLRLLMVFLLVKMADGQFRSLLICSAGGQRFPCCGFIQLNFTSTTSESTSRVHSSSLDAFSSPISPLYRTLLPPLPSATSACVTWRAIFCSLFAQVKHCQWWAPVAINIMKSHIWWGHCANSGLFCSFTW